MPEQPYRVRIQHTGDVVALVPTLLRFYPQESLVLLFLDGPRVVMAGRIDLDDVDGDDHVVDYVLGTSPRSAPDSDGVVVVVVSENRRHDLSATVRAGAVSHGLEIRGALWVPRIEAGARWECLDPCGCSGELPDPRSTPVAVASAVLTGQVTATDREELYLRVRPDGEPTLQQRARLLDGAVPGHDGAGLIAQALSETSAPIEDAVMVQLGLALADMQVYKKAIGHCLDDAGAAEGTWAQLTRGLPGTYAANPATLLAVSALLRGDGALANIAIDRALDADPSHRLATVLSRVLAAGINPEQLREILAAASPQGPRPCGASIPVVDRRGGGVVADADTMTVLVAASDQVATLVSDALDGVDGVRQLGDEQLREHWTYPRYVVVDEIHARIAVTEGFPRRDGVIVVVDGDEPPSSAWQAAAAIGAENVVCLPLGRPWMARTLAHTADRARSE